MPLAMIHFVPGTCTRSSALDRAADKTVIADGRAIIPGLGSVNTEQ